MRDATLEHELAELAASVGVSDVPNIAIAQTGVPHSLADIYDAEIEGLARAAYGRDYLMFGFGDWAAA